MNIEDKIREFYQSFDELFEVATVNDMVAGFIL